MVIRQCPVAVDECWLTSLAKAIPGWWPTCPSYSAFLCFQVTWRLSVVGVLFQQRSLADHLKAVFSEQLSDASKTLRGRPGIWFKPKLVPSSAPTPLTPYILTIGNTIEISVLLGDLWPHDTHSWSKAFYPTLGQLWSPPMNGGTPSTALGRGHINPNSKLPAQPDKNIVDGLCM